MDRRIRGCEKPGYLAQPSNLLDCEVEVSTFVYAKSLSDVIWHENGCSIVMTKNENHN